MARFVTATVTGILAERPGLQRVTVDGQPAYVLTDLVGPVAVGDRVIANTTAVDLGLGSGGWHVVHWNLERDGWSGPSAGHVLKLRYTSQQADVGAAEEDFDEPPHADLGGMPVVVCDLHSQVAGAARAFAAEAPGLRLAYVMADSASLPLVLSDSVADLRGAGTVAVTISAGQAFGGDLEAVNVASALVLARHRAGVDAVIVGPGPGAVGTGTRLGFGSLDAASNLDFAARLGGRPVIAMRCSEADTRARHLGLSHHSLTVLELTGNGVLVPVPRGAWAVVGGDPPWPPRHRAVAVDHGAGALVPPEGSRPLDVMGRTPADDPAFFAWAAAAGALAARLLIGDGATAG